MTNDWFVCANKTSSNNNNNNTITDLSSMKTNFSWTTNFRCGR